VFARLLAWPLVRPDRRAGRGVCRLTDARGRRQPGTDPLAGRGRRRDGRFGRRSRRRRQPGTDPFAGRGRRRDGRCGRRSRRRRQSGTDPFAGRGRRRGGGRGRRSRRRRLCGWHGLRGRRGGLRRRRSSRRWRRGRRRSLRGGRGRWPGNVCGPSGTGLAHILTLARSVDGALVARFGRTEEYTRRAHRPAQAGQYRERERAVSAHRSLTVAVLSRFAAPRPPTPDARTTRRFHGIELLVRPARQGISSHICHAGPGRALPEDDLLREEHRVQHPGRGAGGELGAAVVAPGRVALDQRRTAGRADERGHR